MALTLSQIKLKRRAAEIEALSDEEYFVRESFITYLRHVMWAVISAKKGQAIGLHVIAENNGMTGCTNGQDIFVNVLAPFIAKIKTRKEKLFVIIGLLTHECGHILFTLFKTTEQILKEMEAGSCKNQPASEAILKRHTPGFWRFASMQIARVFNIVEDDFIEYWLAFLFAGLPRLCLEYTRKVATKFSFKNTKENFEKKVPKFERICGLLCVQIANRTSNEVRQLQKWFPKEYAEVEGVFKNCCSIMTEYREAKDRPERRKNLLYALIIQTLPLIEEEYEENMQQQQQKQEQQKQEQQQQQQQEQQQQDGQQGSQGSGEQSSGENSADSEQKSTDGSGNAEWQEQKAQGSGSGSKSPQGQSQGNQKEQAEMERSILEGLEKVLKEIADGTGQMDNSKAQSGIMKNDVPAGNRTESLPETAEEAALNELEAEREEQDRKNQPEEFSDRILNLQRPVKVTDEMIRNYNIFKKRVEPLVTRTTRMLNNVLKERQLEGKLSGQIYGKRIDTRQVYRDDGRFFTRDLSPDGAPKVAFGVRIDESGSMGFSGRINAAKEAAIAVNEILQSLDVAFCIYGDTADEAQPCEVRINRYKEFDSFDDKDKFRLAKIDSYSNNHDAYALRFIGNQMKKRQEPVKVLISISDGKPNARNFREDAAIEKTKKVVEDLEKEGIYVFAAALDGCYNDIVRIYGQKRVMNINILDNLPAELTKLVKKYCLKRS